MTLSLVDRIQEITNAHIWYRHGDSLSGFCRCGITKPITESEHSDHIKAMSREAASNMADRILSSVFRA